MTKVMIPVTAVQKLFDIILHFCSCGVFPDVCNYAKSLEMDESSFSSLD